MQIHPEADAGERSGFAGQQPDPQRPASSAARRVLMELGELKEYFTHYVSARVDRVRAGVRKAALAALLGVIAGIAALTLLICAVVLLVRGIAGGVSIILGRSLWLGELVTGAAVLGVIAAGLYVVWRRMMSAGRRRTVRRYEQREHIQRQRFGRSARDQAQIHRDGRSVPEPSGD